MSGTPPIPIRPSARPRGVSCYSPCRASGTPWPDPRVSYSPRVRCPAHAPRELHSRSARQPFRAALAAICSPRARCPPTRSARQLLSPLPRVRCPDPRVSYPRSRDRDPSASASSVSCFPSFVCETVSRSARQLLPPLSAREGPFIPICASAIQSFFRSVRQLLSPSRRCIPIRASATLSPLPRVRCPYAPFSRVKPFSHVTALARVLTATVRPATRQVSPDPIRASATIPPCPAPHVSYHPRASGLPTNPCVSYTLPHVIQVARQLIPSLSRGAPCLLPS